jgi:hypothetical protein
MRLSLRSIPVALASRVKAHRSAVAISRRCAIQAGIVRARRRIAAGPTAGHATAGAAAAAHICPQLDAQSQPQATGATAATGAVPAAAAQPAEGKRPPKAEFARPGVIRCGSQQLQSQYRRTDELLHEFNPLSWFPAPMLSSHWRTPELDSPMVRHGGPGSGRKMEGRNGKTASSDVFGSLSGARSETCCFPSSAPPSRTGLN